MKTKHIFYLSLIISLCCCGSPYYVPPVDAERASSAHRLYQGALKEGIEIGKKIGSEEGFRQGMSEGLYKGKLMGADSLLTAAQQIDKDEYLLLLSIRAKSFSKQVDAMQDARQRGIQIGREKAWQAAYQEGFNKGYRLAFDSLYKLHISTGETISYPNEIDTKLAIDYRRVVELLNKIGNQYLYVEYTFFANALHEVHTEILRYLVRRLQKDLSLSEQAEVYERYEEMHDKIARIYYRRYLSLCRTRNRNYEQKSFYDYRHYTSADLFWDVVGLGITAVADVVFTYAKSNSQFAATSGFEAMGHIGELIINEVMLPTQDLLLKQAVKLDYDQKRPVIQQSCQATLSPVVADTRIDRKVISSNIYLKSNYRAEVKMEIVTIVKLGFDIDQVILSIDHQKQRFRLSISNTPRYMGLVYQDYKILKVNNEVYVPHPGGTERAVLRNKALENLFKQHKPEPSELDICDKPLTQSALETILPTLIKTLEPSMSLPVSCYHAQVKLQGHLPRQIIKAKCR